MLKCVSITPLGSPVLPLEKITVARSSTLRLRWATAPMALRSSLCGIVHASSRARSVFGDARRLQCIFEEDGSPRNLELWESLDEGLRRDDDFHVALARAGCDHFARRGVVQVDGNAAQHHERVVGERPAHGRRKQHANHLPFANHRAQTAARCRWSSSARRRNGTLGVLPSAIMKRKRKPPRGAHECYDPACACGACADGTPRPATPARRRELQSQWTWAAWACRSSP